MVVGDGAVEKGTILCQKVENGAENYDQFNSFFYFRDL